MLTGIAGACIGCVGRVQEQNRDEKTAAHATGRIERRREESIDLLRQRIECSQRRVDFSEWRQIPRQSIAVGT